MPEEQKQTEKKQAAEEAAVAGPSMDSTGSPRASSGQAGEQVQPVETELDKIKKERDEYLAGWQRAKADFLNYQKDERRRQEEFLKFAQAAFVEDLLPVLDSFDLALNEIAKPVPSEARNLVPRNDSGEGIASASPHNDRKEETRNDNEGAARNDTLTKGLFLIKSQLDEILKRRGLEPIKAAGEKFDPEFHEAVIMIEDKEKEPETIIEEMQKGYILNGRVLRPTKVKIVK